MLPNKLNLLSPAVLLTVFSLFAVACSKGEFSDVETLPVDNYVKNPGDYMGNNYMLNAQIDEQIRWEKGLGRVLAVSLEGSSKRLPVFVPEAVGGNLHVGQRYEMKVIIDRGGLIYVEELRKY